jgi:RHS repeat-associated protein
MYIRRLIKNKFTFWMFSIILALYSGFSFGIMYTVDKEIVISKDNNIKSCTAGYNVLSGQIEYNKPIISGALPYNLNYRKTTRHHIIDSEKELGVDSWSDNYDGFVESYSGTYFTANNNFILIKNYTIKLPGDASRYYFKNGPTSFKDVGYPEPKVTEYNRALYRIYGSTEPPASSLPGGGWSSGGSSSTNFGEIQFTVGTNLMTVIRNGIEYSATVSKSSNGRVIFRFNKIKYPDGNVVNLSYDSGLNLVSVSDSKNNVLTLTRNGAQVTSIKFTSGTQGDYQQYDFSYNNVTAGTVNYLQLTEVKNRLNGRKESYTYSSTLSLPYYEAAKQGNVANPEVVAQRPTLKSVQNHLGQAQQTWQVDYPSVVFDSSKYISNSKTVLRSYLGENPTALDISTTYDDTYNSSQITMAFSPDGNQSASTIINTTHPDFTKTNIDVTGYPCLTVNGKPIKYIVYAPADKHPTQITDQKGIITAYTFDDKNRISQVIEAVGSSISRTATYVYSTLSNGAINLFNIPNKITKGTVTVNNVINVNGQVISQTQTSTQTGSTSKTTTYTYYTDVNSSSNGLLSSEDGPRSGTSDKINYSYDNYGNLATKSSTINGSVRTEQHLGYNSFGQPERIVQANGMVKKFNYNVDGSVSNIVFGTGSTTGVVTGQNYSFTYDDLGQLRVSVLPDGDSKSFNYDQIGRLVKTVAEDGSIFTKTYFKNNVVSSDLLNDNSGTTLVKSLYRSIDGNGRISKVQLGTDSNSNTINFSYDLNGNVLEIASALGINETWTYDELNRMKTHKDGNGNVDTRGYDANDNLGTLNDAFNSGLTFYDQRNNNILTREYNQDYGEKKYTYNEADQIIQSLFGNRKCSFPNIDEIGRNRNVNCQNVGGNTDALLAFDNNYNFDVSRFGRLDSITSNAAYGVNTNYSYDLFDRIISKSQLNKALTSLGTSENISTVSYEWSLGNKLVSQTLPSGRKLNLNYNSAQKAQLSNITLDGTPIINSISYNGGGDITGWNWGVGGRYSIIYSSNSTGAIKQIANTNSSGGINYSLDYGFDRDGRIVSISRNNNINDTYAYDNAGNLTNESRANGSNSVYSIGYTYDQNRNRKTLRASGAHLQSASTVDYSYTKNKLTSFIKDGTSQPINYTANAELYFGSNTANYDYAGRRRGDGQSNNFNRYMSYTANNERSLISLSSSWTYSTIQFVYDENSNLIGEYTYSGVPIVEYVWLEGKPIAAIYGSGAETKIYYIVTDVLNTPRRLIDSSTGNIEWSWDSTAFGVGAPTGSITFNLRFSGQYYDSATGQFYNLNRFYNPELGRYMESDPSGMAGGLNPYIYALNNPNIYVDHNGKHPIVGIMIVGGIVGGVVGGGINALGQAYDIYNDPSKSFNGYKFFAAVGAGIATGALAPVATSFLSAAALGATSSSASYAIGQYIDNKPVTPFGLATSALAGATFGGLMKAPSLDQLKYRSYTKSDYNKLFWESYSDKALGFTILGAAAGEGSSKTSDGFESSHSREIEQFIRDWQRIDFEINHKAWSITVTLPTIKLCWGDCILEK